MHRSSGTWVIWLSRALFNPWYRLALSGCSAAGVAVSVVLDREARSAGVPSPVALDSAVLWAALGAGFGLGALFVGWEWVQLTYSWELNLRFHRAPYSERTRWEYQRPNLIWNGWLIFPVMGLFLWCIWAEVSPYPPFMAAMTPSVALWRLVSRFGEELRSAVAAEGSLN